jgi:hypothetical protein
VLAPQIAAAARAPQARHRRLGWAPGERAGRRRVGAAKAWSVLKRVCPWCARCALSLLAGPHAPSMSACTKFTCPETAQDRRVGCASSSGVRLRPTSTGASVGSTDKALVTNTSWLPAGTTSPSLGLSSSRPPGPPCMKPITQPARNERRASR